MNKALSLLLAFCLSLALLTGAFAEEPDISSVTVASPNGAPAIALATLAADDPEQYRYVAADAIAAEFAGATADFIIAPINAGAKLFKAGKSTYQLAAVVSWGNLFIASQKSGFTPEDLNGATVTLFGENTINASVVLYSLKENGIEPAAVEYLAGAANTQALLLSDEDAIVVTAEPALTAAKMKNEKITSYAVNDLFKNATGFEGYTQAGLFVKAELAAEQPELVNAFLKAAEEACMKCENDLDAVVKAAVALEILPNEKVASAAIPGCAIRFATAKDAREQIETTAGIDLSQFGGEVPADNFYYEGE